MRVVIIIPTYNEAENLPHIVDVLLGLSVDGLQILVVDDNSPDGTGQVAEELARAYPRRIYVLHRPSKQGLGTAYVAGFLWALEHGADYIFEMDADFSHAPSCVPLFLEAIKDCDVVVGSRYVSGGGVDERWSLWRHFLSWGGNLYARLITGLQVRDATSGFKCFRREALQELELPRVRSDGYAFQIEIALACEKKGYRIKEIPIHFLDRQQGQSKMSLGIVLEALWRVWEIRWRYGH